MNDSSTLAGRDLADDLLPARAPARTDDGTLLRIVGPGRRERGYLERLAELASELGAAQHRGRELEQHLRMDRAALETSQRVEHGCQRRIDRLETRLEERTQALLDSERQHKRLALALGSLQRENELLHQKLVLALAPPVTGATAAASSALRAGFWRRLFRRAR